MALFTDAEIVTLDDLLQYEGSLASVTSSHAIDVETKIGLATSAIGDKLLLWLLQAGAADPQWNARRTLGLSTVVVTTTLQKWMCFEALARVFGEAYNVQLNTRFQGKLTEYQNEARSAADLCFLSGIGLVSQALPKPARPLISIQAGNSPAQTLYVQTSWTDASGGESALSPANSVVLEDSSSIAVAMAEGAGSPSAAAGWNVYVGPTAQDLSRQNSGAIDLGSTWQLASTGLISGANGTDGQAATAIVDLRRQIRRG